MPSIHLPLCRFTLLTSHASSSHFINIQDVSNRFNAECSKQAKAAASKQAKAAKAKSNKRAVSTIYLQTAPDASKADDENGVTSKTKSEAPSVTQSVDNKHTDDVADTVTLRVRAKPVQSKHFKATTKSYEDGTPHDIDKRDRNDPSCATAYVQDMYEYFREQEHRAVVVPYLEGQHKINARMRYVLWTCVCSYAISKSQRHLPSSSGPSSSIGSALSISS